MRFSVTLSYDGAPFCGWQVQPGDPSVQACLEDALSKLLRTRVSVTGAGRTDSGVHGIGYVAHFDIEDVREAPDPAEIAYKLNAILPPSVVVHSVAPVAPDFHARFDASKRKYTYFLHRMKDPFVENYSLRRDWDLDFAAMNRAAALLPGRHDFACFEKTGTDVRTSICTVSEAYWAPYTPTHVALMGFAPAASAPAKASAGTPEGSPADGGLRPSSHPASSAAQTTCLLRLSSPPFQQGCPPAMEAAEVLDSCGWRYAYFRISADRFLRNMVRAVVGTLLEVGRGKRTVEEFGALILPEGAEKRENLRSLAGDSVPGHALFFSGAEYDAWHLTH